MANFLYIYIIFLGWGSLTCLIELLEMIVFKTYSHCPNLQLFLLQKEAKTKITKVKEFYSFQK